MSAALELRQVSHEYVVGHVVTPALADVDIEIAAGTMVAIIGPSGSGKSTLLKLAGGLESPTAGEVVVGGVSLRGHSDAQLATLRRRSVGYVFQEYNLVPSLTLAENVSLPLELDGVPREAAREAALAELEAVGMIGHADDFPTDVSGGERQRTAIARGMVGDRSLIIADEPTGALDSLTGESIMRLLRRHCTRGRTVAFATHNVSHAAWADLVVYLRDGRVIDQTRYAGVDVLLQAEGARR
jgi:putative ABC transport system ATP-binding protein